MNEINSQLFSSEELLKKIQDQEVEPSINQIRRLLSGMHPSEVAHSIESLPPKERKFLWSLIDTQDEGEIIAELHDEIQQELISEISAEELITILGDLELDEIVDILQVLPDRKTENILSAMSLRDRKRIREAGE